MRKTFLILAAAAMTLMPMTASAARGYVVVGRPYYGGWYHSYWGGPYWGPYWGPGFGYYSNPNVGEIKLDTKVKDAQVFLNGAYAGTTHEAKSLHLRPG